MRLTKELLEKINACQEGYQSFIDEFPDGGDYKDVLTTARYLDAVHGNIGREAFIRMMARNPKVWLHIEGTRVKEIFHVFNPLTGQHITCNSVEEAKETQQKCISDYIETQKHLFSVAQEIETVNGDTLWNPIDLDKM